MVDIYVYVVNRAPRLVARGAKNKTENSSSQANTNPVTLTMEVGVNDSHNYEHALHFLDYYCCLIYAVHARSQEEETT